MMKKAYLLSIDTSKLKNDRAKKGEHYVPTDLEHVANMITHGICILPSLYGLKSMQENAASRKEVVTLLIYGLALFCLFTMSTLYHCLSFAGAKGLLRHFFHLGDRAVIFIFIAASYTPWLVLKDFDGAADLTMWVVWVGCVLGILYQFLFHHKFKSLEIVFYLIVGICPAYAVTHMTDPSGVFELAVGGVIYVSGVVFFKCDGIIPFAHAIWHCFVFLGALAHFYAINKYLVGAHASSLQGIPGRCISNWMYSSQPSGHELDMLTTDLLHQTWTKHKAFTHNISLVYFKNLVTTAGNKL